MLARRSPQRPWRRRLELDRHVLPFRRGDTRSPGARRRSWNTGRARSNHGGRDWGVSRTAPPAVLMSGDIRPRSARRFSCGIAQSLAGHDGGARHVRGSPIGGAWPRGGGLEGRCREDEDILDDGGWLDVSPHRIGGRHVERDQSAPGGVRPHRREGCRHVRLHARRVDLPDVAEHRVVVTVSPVDRVGLAARPIDRARDRAETVSDQPLQHVVGHSVQVHAVARVERDAPLPSVLTP